MSASTSELTAKVYTDWEPEELWRHEQMNFAAHMALTFTYLQDRGLSLDDFYRYIGEKVVPSWRECAGIADFMNYTLVNVVANGGEVLESNSNDQRATATVTEILRSDVGERVGVAPAVLNSFWEKFVPIASSLGLVFTWERTVRDQYRFKVSRG